MNIEEFKLLFFYLCFFLWFVILFYMYFKIILGDVYGYVFPDFMYARISLSYLTLREEE